MKKNTPKPKNNRTEVASWRQRLHVLEGTANEDIQGKLFSADVDLVAFNVAKNITSADLCNWLSQRGLLVKDCKVLTTSEEARFLSFKVTVDPKDFDRATNDSNLWPYRVGVRLFKHFNKHGENNNRNTEARYPARDRKPNKYNGYNNNGYNGYNNNNKRKY